MSAPVLNETELKSKVPRPLAGLPLVAYLAKRFPYHSAAEWSQHLAQSRISVNGEICQHDEIVVKAGDMVGYRTVRQEPEVNLQIKIVHEESAFLVAEKPPLIPAHADGNFIQNTFIYRLQRQVPAATEKLLLVHRLDREASGLMVVAKTHQASKHLAMQFGNNEVTKEYWAVVVGQVAPERLRADNYLGTDPKSSISIRRAVVPPETAGAQHAVTDFQTVQRGAGISLLKAMPKTGRTHQIRVHLAALGYPIVGDKLYGKSDDEYLAWVHHVKQDPKAALVVSSHNPRLMLHACRLAFFHPLSGKRIAFESPLPDDIKNIVFPEKFAKKNS